MISKKEAILKNAYWNTRFDERAGIKILKLSEFLDIEDALSGQAIEILSDETSLMKVLKAIKEKKSFYFRFNEQSKLEFEFDVED
jgi:hypothetical protein